MFISTSKPKLLKMFVQIDFDKVKRNFQQNLAYTLGKGYPLKYSIALALAGALKEYSWIQEVYYSEISVGEFVEGEDVDGRDVDILIKTSIPSPSVAKLLGQELEEVLNKALKELCLHQANSHNLVEIHVDDLYVKAVSDALASGRTPHNAILLYCSKKARQI